MPLAFTKSHFEDRLLQSFQDACFSSFSDLDKIPFLRGKLLQGLTLASNVTKNISHLLQRPYVGFIITRTNAAASIYEDNAVNRDQSLYIGLRASAAVSFDLWVF